MSYYYFDFMRLVKVKEFFKMLSYGGKVGYGYGFIIVF